MKRLEMLVVLLIGEIKDFAVVLADKVSFTVYLTGRVSLPSPTISHLPPGSIPFT